MLAKFFAPFTTAPVKIRGAVRLPIFRMSILHSRRFSFFPLGQNFVRCLGNARHRAARPNVIC